MNIIEDIHVQCPYCGEAFTVAADRTTEGEPYVEDCQVCCRPIEFHLRVGDDGEVGLETVREDA